MLVTEAECLVRELENSIRREVAAFEEATTLIVDSIYVNRISTTPTGGKRQSILNSIECEVRLL